MEPTDLTVRLLQDIRDAVRQTNERIDSMNGQFSQRFEVLETTLRDPAEQMVMLARGVRTAIETRGRVEEKLEEHERRLADIERRLPH